MNTIDLRASFQAYLEAETRATRAYIDYSFGRVTEREVHRLQRLERLAADEHLAAIDSLTAQADR